MTRDISDETLSAAQADSNIPIALVKLEFASGDLRLHTQLGDILYNGEVYTGAGDIGMIGPIDEDFDLTRNSMQIGLRGVPNEIIAIALGENYQGRPATIYFGYLDPTTRQLVGDPLIFSMLMDYPTATVGKTPQVVLRVEDEFALLDKPLTRRYNNADQQAEYPGDLGLEFVEQSVEKQIFWGQATPQ